MLMVGIFILILKENEPGVNWDIIGEGALIKGTSDWCIARNDLVCGKCGEKYNIFFTFDRVENKDGDDYLEIEEMA